MRISRAPTRLTVAFRRETAAEGSPAAPLTPEWLVRSQRKDTSDSTCPQRTSDACMISSPLPTPLMRRTRFHPPQHVPWPADTHPSRPGIPESPPLPKRPPYHHTHHHRTCNPHAPPSPLVEAPSLPTNILLDRATLTNDLAPCPTLEILPSRHSGNMPACLDDKISRRHQEIHSVGSRINYRLTALP